MGIMKTIQSLFAQIMVVTWGWISAVFEVRDG